VVILNERENLSMYCTGHCQEEEGLYTRLKCTVSPSRLERWRRRVWITVEDEDGKPTKGQSHEDVKYSSTLNKPPGK